MKGRVDTSGRALLEIELQPTEKGSPQAVAVWIDTGFTGDLVLPRALVEKLALQQSGTASAILADGSQVAMRTYTCFIQWFGQQLCLEVVANDGEYPLLGVGLLLQRELNIDYRSNLFTMQ